MRIRGKCFPIMNLLEKPLASRYFFKPACGSQAWRDTELKIQGGALRVELDLSGFFSAQIPTLKNGPGHIEVTEAQEEMQKVFLI